MARGGRQLNHLAFGVFDLARASWQRLPTGAVQATPGAKWGQGGQGSRTGVACLLLDRAARTLILLCCVHLCLCVACAGASLSCLCVCLAPPAFSLLPFAPLLPPSPFLRVSCVLLPPLWTTGCCTSERELGMQVHLGSFGFWLKCQTPVARAKRWLRANSWSHSSLRAVVCSSSGAEEEECGY
jgi:hypothetical protein